ncbi:MAG: hypothetical protein Q8936_12975 [Bacillota bacterium]|nr:hypothetical protein [Bacillota bacterium]
MKIVIISDIKAITLEHCLECQRAHLDIFVDEGCIITVQKADSCENLKN